MSKLHEYWLRIRNIAFLKRQTAAQAAVFLTLITLLSKPLAAVREWAIAHAFGTSPAKDAFVIAQNLPSIFGTMVAAALIAAFIPIFIRLREQEGEQSAWALASRVATLLGVIMIVSCSLLFLLADPSVTLLAPGLEAERHDLAVTLTRYMIPTILLTTYLSLFRSILNAYQHFLLPAIAGLAENLIMVAAVLALSPSLGILSLVIGTFASNFAQLGLVGGGLLIRKPMLHLNFQWRNRDLSRVFRMMIPLVIGGSAGLINLLVDRTVGSFLPQGSIAALDYALKIYTIPSGMFITSLVSAVYPTLAIYWARLEADNFRRSLGKGLYAVWYIILPSTAGLTLLGQPIISVLLQSGAFTPEDTALTAAILLYYSLGLFASAGAALLANAFVILGDTLTPMWLSFMAIGLNLNLNLILAGPMGAPGLALATTISGAVNFVTLLYFLQRRIGKGVFVSLWLPVGKIGLASLIMGLSCLGLWNLLDRLFHPASYLARLVVVFGVVFAGILIYLGLSVLLRIEEVKRYQGYWRRMLQRLQRRPDAA